MSSHQAPSDLGGQPYSRADWIGHGLRFEIVEDNIELEGYQLYAVEKWYVVYLFIK